MQDDVRMYIESRGTIERGKKKTRFLFIRENRLRQIRRVYQNLINTESIDVRSIEFRE